LTEEESQILGMIQTQYGLQNTAESIPWINGNKASLWVTDASGATVLMVHLSSGDIEPISAQLKDMFYVTRFTDTYVS
jgi:hypothetical protein